MVGTRSRAIRGSTIDSRVRCTASDGRCIPARPALHVSTRLLHSPASFPVRLRLPTPLHERAFRTTLHLLWTCCAGRAGTHRRSKALMPALPSGNLPAVRPGARPYRGWAFYHATGIARLGHGACGVVGTGSRMAPARPALNVSTLIFVASGRRLRFSCISFHFRTCGAGSRIPTISWHRLPKRSESSASSPRRSVHDREWAPIQDYSVQLTLILDSSGKGTYFNIRHSCAFRRLIRSNRQTCKPSVRQLGCPLTDLQPHSLLFDQFLCHSLHRVEDRIFFDQRLDVSV